MGAGGARITRSRPSVEATQMTTDVHIETRMTGFIDLQRRFHDLTDSEPEDIESLLAWSGSEFGPDIGWSELLQYARVILLAEAGTGKTDEMRQQVKRLTGEGRFAFFIPLESLGRDSNVDILDILSVAKEGQDERFKQWKANGRKPAWFFLDAVDELKLIAGKLDRALSRLSRAMDGHLAHTRIIISCRPSDWRSGSDLNTVQHRLPVPEVRRESSVQPPEEVFMEALRHERGGQSYVAPEEDEIPNQGTVRTVAMLPMSDEQIKVFAGWRGMSDPAAFLAEIARQDAWIFARRPLDLTDLVELWSSSGRLGTRAEQHEANITAKLKDDPERPDRGVLADTKARLGAERLALALALTGTRTIRSPDQALDRRRTDGVLDAATALPDWTPAERQALLRRALFDPATYGRVRFHHRSVQEYLAAQRLRGLHEKGMSIKALFRLLFAERYGVEVVFPSMREIAAWLALWVDAVRKVLIEREPETLVSLGDPGSLDLASRGELLRAFVSEYGRGDWRGLSIPLAEVRRLAHPKLATVIRECWGSGPENDEVRKLLIHLIRLGPVEGCADLAHDVALDTAASEYHRIIAIEALLACGWNDRVRDLTGAMSVEPTSWPDRVVHGVAADLFPAIITADDLVALMERTREPKQSVGGFDWAARQIVKSIEVGSDSAVALRDKMADLLWRGHKQTQDSYHIHSVFGHLAPALAMLCDRQLSATTGRPQADLIRAAVIASRFGGRRVGGREPVRKLREHFNESAALRSDAFWAELEFMDEVSPSDDGRQRLHHAEQEGLAGYLTEADRPWLEAALADERRPERHVVALHAWIDGWHQRGQVMTELDAIRANLKEDALRVQILEQRTAPREPDERFEKMERDHERWKRDEACREAQRLEKWREWRDELLADSDDAFSETKQQATVSNLYSWLSANEQIRNRFDRWDKDALVQAFGQDVADRAEKAFRTLWRDAPPVLWSARPIDERSHILPDWAYGLTGISAEATTPGWTTSLLPCEARTAAAYATIGMNGFAPFIIDLTKSHPKEVEEVIGGEVSAELRMGGDHGHLPALENVAYSDSNLKQLLTPRLIAELRSWPTDVTVDTQPHWERHLDNVLRILTEANDVADRETIARECVGRYEADPLGALALVWLRGLFRFDAIQGTQVLIRSLGNGKAASSADRAIETFAALFGDRGAVAFEVEDTAQCVRLLGQLVRYAYAFVRPEDDQVHEGVYTPNARDNAQTARHFLLSMLFDTPGPDARRVLLELADEDDFAHLADRLRFQAHQRAATDAEFQPFSPEDVIALDTRHEAPPHDSHGLFTVMMDRLGDLADDLAHHDFTIRQTVRRIPEEPEMQRYLAKSIADKANGVYVVTREEEVADAKHTDIRLSSTKGDSKAVVEVKIADNWTPTELVRALRNQLVGQYLRHSICRAGCLLLTYHGRKGYWKHPRTGRHMTFPKLVAFLTEKAQAVENEHAHDVRIRIFGLDLTDPPLAPAHTGNSVGGAAH